MLIYKQKLLKPTLFNSKLLKPIILNSTLTILAICLKIVENYCNNFQTQIFAPLLVLFLAGRPHYY